MLSRERTRRSNGSIQSGSLRRGGIRTNQMHAACARMTRIPDFHEEMDRFQNHIPSWIADNLKRLRGERAIWVRVPMGVALIGGGVLGFLPLPIVSIWMLPVGLALLAHDIPTMRGPMARLLHFTNRKIEKRKR